MKKWALLLAVVFLGVFVGIALAQGLSEKVTIDNKYTAKKKGPVVLTHKKHAEDYKVACTECHHDWDQKPGTKPKKCADCHKEQAQGKVVGLMQAYHKNCLDCHKNLQKQGKPTGPTTKCNDCHQEKKS